MHARWRDVSSSTTLEARYARDRMVHDARYTRLPRRRVIPIVAIACPHTRARAFLDSIRFDREIFILSGLGRDSRFGRDLRIGAINVLGWLGGHRSKIGCARP